jgi:hypothetical protein
MEGAKRRVFGLEVTLITQFPMHFCCDDFDTELGETQFSEQCSQVGMKRDIGTRRFRSMIY